MRHILRSGAALALAAALACAPALAQMPPSPPPRGLMPRQQDAMPGPVMGDAPGADMPGADPLQVLANSFEVQRDLGLTQHQLDNLQLASRNFLTQMQEIMGRANTQPPEQVRAAIEDQMAKTRPMIGRELTPAQLARLQEIMLQIQGPCIAIVDPGAEQRLRLSPQERTQAGQVCQQRGMQMRASFQPPAPGEDPCAAAARNRDVLMRIRADSDARVLAVFSPEQKAEFVRMQGRPLHLEPPMPPGCMVPGRPG